MATNANERIRVTVDPDWYEPYAISLGIRVGDLVFVSGQAGVDDSGRTVEGGFNAQARQSLRNVERVLTSAGSGLEHVAKVTIFITDISVLDQVIELRREFFTPPFPADTIVQVAALASPEWQIEIEAIGVIPSA